LIKSTAIGGHNQIRSSHFLLFRTLSIMDDMQPLDHILRDRRPVVVKVGTNLLAEKARGINRSRIDQIVQGLAHWRERGFNVVLVSSGAIGAGVAALRLPSRPKSIPGQQAAAAVGQPLLMEAYERAFRNRNMPIAQILLTKDDFDSRSRYVNARNTFTALFDHAVVPVVNENDSIAVEEIKVGDNDNLSAFVAGMVGAALLVILTDTGGLYSDDPATVRHATLIPVVDRITPHIERLAKNSTSELSTGGMATKLQAARQCIGSGIAMIIADGRQPTILQDLCSGVHRGTLFLPAARKLSLRRQWIGYVAGTRGYVVVDNGARNAILVRKKSLLPSGVLEVHGKFSRGDAIAIRDAAGKEFARGLAEVSAAELDRIKGKRTSEAAATLGDAAPVEIIHRNNLAVLSGGT
jgi:glutamate 5-kinase